MLLERDVLPDFIPHTSYWAIRCRSKPSKDHHMASQNCPPNFTCTTIFLLLSTHLKVQLENIPDWPSVSLLFVCLSSVRLRSDWVLPFGNRIRPTHYRKVRQLHLVILNTRVVHLLTLWRWCGKDRDLVSEKPKVFCPSALRIAASSCGMNEPPKAFLSDMPAFCIPSWASPSRQNSA